MISQTACEIQCISEEKHLVWAESFAPMHALQQLAHNFREKAKSFPFRPKRSLHYKRNKG
jgi:hypothetical protein